MNNNDFNKITDLMLEIDNLRKENKKLLLEKEADKKLLTLHDVISQRELLLDFAEYSENDKTSTALDECVDNYLDSIKQ